MCFHHKLKQGLSLRVLRRRALLRARFSASLIAGRLAVCRRTPAKLGIAVRKTDGVDQRAMAIPRSSMAAVDSMPFALCAGY